MEEECSERGICREHEAIDGNGRRMDGERRMSGGRGGCERVRRLGCMMTATRDADVCSVNREYVWTRGRQCQSVDERRFVE